MKKFIRKDKKLRKGVEVYIKGKESKKFLPNEMLIIYSDKVIIKKKEKYREVSNMGNVVRDIKQKYIHIKRGK